MNTAIVVGTIWAMAEARSLEVQRPDGCASKAVRRCRSGRYGTQVKSVQGSAEMRCRDVNRTGSRAGSSRVAANAMVRAELNREVVEETSPEMAFYRKYTEGMLRRYMRMSLEMGRVPSMLGKELFRGKVTSYRVKSFEDVIIFVHDVEKCLARLDATSLQLIGRISLQEYTQGETAGLTGMSLRSVTRKYAEALDSLTAVFLELDLLERQTEPGCQGSSRGRSAGSH